MSTMSLHGLDKDQQAARLLCWRCADFLLGKMTVLLIQSTKFGEEYRPCKLTKHVYGTFRKKEQNDFMFTRVLDFKLYAILKQHSVNKPVLVFCATRKGTIILSSLRSTLSDSENAGVVATAEQLMKEYEEDAAHKQNVPWSRPTR